MSLCVFFPSLFSPLLLVVDLPHLPVLAVCDCRWCRRRCGVPSLFWYLCCHLGVLAVVLLLFATLVCKSFFASNSFVA